MRAKRWSNLLVLREVTYNSKILLWRERMGVEPTMDTEEHPSTDLKSAKLTGAPSLPQTGL